MSSATGGRYTGASNNQPTKEHPMATVIADMSMSLDGYVADTEDRTDQVFGWYFGGDTPVPTANPDITRQCLDAGLLDGIRVSLVPVLLGGGVPWFANLAGAPIQLEGPTVTEGAGVTHLDYRIKR